MLLGYLVTSDSRRELLRLLWSEDRAGGSVSELARRADLSFGAAHRELEAMRTAGLATSERVGSMVVYKAAANHEHGELLRRLVKESKVSSTTEGSDAANDVRGWLVAAGAPFWAESSKQPAPPLEDVVVAGLQLAHHDASVARVLPVVLWKNKRDLDLPKLLAAATRRNEGATLGYFLDLTAHLGGDRSLAAAAKPLRDLRRTRARLFFANTKGRMAVAAAKAKTPRLARKWGYLMNMELEAFASAFAKHASVR
jgi:DNA-binding transcriptional ArsR family regulator